jgi:hypothetical protein
MTQSPYGAADRGEPARGAAPPAELLASSRDPDVDRDHRGGPRLEAAVRDRLDRLVPAMAWRAVAVALAVGLVAGHLWSSSAAPPATAGPAPRASSPTSTSRTGSVLPPPAVGLCHDYSREAEGGANEESKAVPCSGDHDAVTVARVDHPDVNLPYDGSYLQASLAMVTCQRAAERYLGIGPGVTFTRYSSAVYEPDPAQLAAGQRWLRCDLVKFPTFLGLMPLPGQLRGSMRTGPDLKDAFCVQPDALAQGLPRADRMEAPELGDWRGQADCFGTHALVVVRRAPAASPARAAAACTTASHRFRGLGLTALAPPADEWTDEVLCVARIADYETWLAHGKPMA